ncbi:MAG: NAD(P)H-dependent oxidoreductase [Aestuariivita sp.]|nr:NAD(P)H-dependent oxidoreductase [Aestuariivita sp.]
MYSLLGISGSLRVDAMNRKLIREAARLFAQNRYVEADINFPLFDADVEAQTGIPAAVERLIDDITKADAVVISTPEYNKGPSGALKNALDWVSRASNNPWRGKPVAVMSASAGRAGGERAQSVLRGFMVPFRPRIMQGPEIHLANAAKEFNEEGHLTSMIYLETLQELMDELLFEVLL